MRVLANGKQSVEIFKVIKTVRYIELFVVLATACRNYKGYVVLSITSRMISFGFG